MKNEVYHVEGMTCASCSAAIERVTRKMPGVEKSEVNLLTKELSVTYDEGQVTPEMIIGKVERAGFSAWLPQEKKAEAPKGDDEEKALRARSKGVIAALVLAALLLYVSMLPMVWKGAPMPELIGMHSHPVNYALIQLILSTPILFIGRGFYKRGFKALWHRQPNMDSLVALGSGCAFVYSVAMTFLISDNPAHVHHLYYESAAVVVTLVMLGKHMEARSSHKTTGAVRALMELAPDTALLVGADGSVREVASGSVAAGQIIMVQPGMRIPLDGTVESGETAADESMLTGESIPVDKMPGDSVIGGSMNVSGLIRVKVTRTGENTTLAGIIRFIQEAQAKKAPISKLADRVSGYFVPVVMAIAVLAAALWALAGKDSGFVLKVLVSVLVIACPCAMGLATPTAIIVGTGLGARHGILIRSGEKLEMAHKVDTVLLDKTGTMTHGKPQVVDILPLDGSEEDLLALAAAAERGSRHPLAGAVLSEVEKRGAMVTDSAEKLLNVPGRGVEALLLSGRRVFIGNEQMMLDNGVDISPAANYVEAHAGRGETLMYIASNQSLKGVLALADPVKDGVQDVVKTLKSMNITPVLVSGDREDAVRAAAAKAGIDAWESGVLPGDKAALVEKYRQMGKTVMMVGDGINDAPALAAADVGCAIGGGTDIAIEAADIILMRDDLADVARAVLLSRYTIRNIKQNLTWAFIYNIIGIPVAAGVAYAVGGPMMEPMLGGLAMSLSSVSVVTNALSLRRKKL